MRALLASSIGVTAAALLLTPLAPLPASAASDPERPASTQSLPLTSLDEPSKRSGSATQDTRSAAGAGLAARDVEPFSLLGVVWEDPSADLHGKVRVRTRSAETGKWSGWQELEAHTEDAPDPESEERRGRELRGGTAPVWVGAADGVEVRVRPEAGQRIELPGGLRVELIDPGSGPDGMDEDEEDGTDDKPDAAPADLTPEAAASSAVNARLADIGADRIPPLGKEATEDGVLAAQISQANTAESASGAQSRPYVGPRPGIVTRKGWKANERLREKNFLYTRTVKAAFVHHTATGNNYSCKRAPALLRSIYRYHVKSLGWRDVGYNFFVDKCGTIYEGRAGGVANPVMGAHTYGFNSNTTGIAVLGSYGSTKPPKAAVDGVAKLTAWKLGLHGVNPRGSVTLVSGGGKYKKGTRVRMNTISGHRDGFVTSCPGAKLYSNLGTARAVAARLQGR